MKRMSMKFFILAVTVTFFAFMLSGCSGSGNGGSNSATASSEYDIPDDKPVIMAASDALAAGNITSFNGYLSKTTGAISVSSEKAKVIAEALKNAKMISEDGVGMKTWEMTFNGEKIRFCTILEDGEWKIL